MKLELPSVVLLVLSLLFLSLLFHSPLVLSAALPSGSVLEGASLGEDAVVLSELVVDQALLEGEDAPFVECHASTIVETKPGFLTAAWFGGQREGSTDVRIWLSRRDKSGWSDPEPVTDGLEDSQQYPTWNPVLFQPEKGRLLLFYKVGPSPREWWGRVMESKRGRKWKPSKRLPDGFLGPVRNKPIILADGTWLAGSSTEGRRSGGQGADGRAAARDVWKVHFERSVDEGETWSMSRPEQFGIPEDGSLQVIQPTLLEHDDGRVQALNRSQNGRIVETWSKDSGVTWGPLVPIGLPNPNAAIDAVKLADGRFLMVYNHQIKEGGRWLGSRRKLNVAVSDDGVLWSAAVELENDPPAKKGGAYPPGEYSYPAVVQASDGKVHVIYTWRRKNLRHVVIDPARLEPVSMPDGEWPDDERLAD